MDIKKLKFIIFLLLCFSLNFLYSKILTIYSDEGIPQGSNLYTWSAGGLGQFNSKNSDLLQVPVGTESFKTVSNPWWNPGGWWENWAGWGVVYNNEQNLSFYNNGRLRFWIYASVGNIRIEIEAPTGNKNQAKYLTDLGWSSSDINKWKFFDVPLSSFNIETYTAVKCPFMITAALGNSTNSTTFYVDFVRWVSSDVSSPYFNIKIKDIETHIQKSSITFNVNLQQVSSWTVANEYIEIDFDPNNISWGIQIYTDNKAQGANPVYTGNKNPCGLVDTTTTTRVLPMGWTIESSTRTKQQLGKGTPESWVYGGFMWKWMKDKNTQGFQNGENYITLWNNRGVLWNASDRDWKNSPNYIYLSADFSIAVGGRTYRTNQLKIELYYK